MSEPAKSSPLTNALAQVGDRWTLLVVEALLEGPRRFNELAEELDGIAPNILSDRLKRLEKEALLVARPYSKRPVRVAYELSSDGSQLAGALRLLSHWGSRRAGGPAGPRHEACDTPLETRWYCPTCQLVIESPDDEELRFL
ncbi:MAG: helix-turn-helix transcriptional regulator [Actinobacteria bacterium]|nr:helix-turn-helix transcriptional regulator [Actinomycetota bacterium]